MLDYRELMKKKFMYLLLSNLFFIYRPFLLPRKHCQYFRHLQRNQRDRRHHCRSQNQSRQHGALVQVVLRKALLSIKLQERRSASTQKAKVKLMRKVHHVLIFNLLRNFDYFITHFILVWLLRYLLTNRVYKGRINELNVIQGNVK